MGGDASDSRVGVFWMVQADENGSAEPVWLFHVCPTDAVEPYGECMTCPHGHHDLWDAWRGAGSVGEVHVAVGLTTSVRATVRVTEYDDWPRGRVVREPDRSVVYADGQLLRADRRLHLIEVFALDPMTTVFRRDAHYVRSRRLEGP